MRWISWAERFLARHAWVLSALALVLFYTHPVEVHFAFIGLTVSRAAFQDIVLCVFGGMILLQAVRPLRGDALCCAAVNLLPAFLILSLYGSRLSLWSTVCTLVLVGLMLIDLKAALSARSRRRRRRLMRSTAITFCIYFMISSLPGTFYYLVQDKGPAQGPLLLRTELPAAGERASSPAYTDLACILSVLWEDMDVESRLETLERVLEAEAECLGIRTPRLTAACLAEDDKNANGQYNHTRDRIELDEEALMTRDGRDTLETLLHECRHAYQHSVVDMIDWSHEAAKQHAFFAEARAWREEHIGASVYNNSPEGIEEYFLEYYYTAIELDAREYARARIREIIEEMWYPEYGI